jgi:hypothetical protein
MRWKSDHKLMKGVDRGEINWIDTSSPTMWLFFFLLCGEIFIISTFFYFKAVSSHFRMFQMEAWRTLIFPLFTSRSQYWFCVVKLKLDKKTRSCTKLCVKPHGMRNKFFFLFNICQEKINLRNFGIARCSRGMIIKIQLILEWSDNEWE